MFAIASVADCEIIMIKGHRKSVDVLDTCRQRADIVAKRRVWSQAADRAIAGTPEVIRLAFPCVLYHHHICMSYLHVPQI